MQPLGHIIETLTGQPPIETVLTIGSVTTAAGGVFAPEETRPITHERPKPVDWDALVDFAASLPVYKQIDGQEAYYDDASVDALRARLELLDDETVDEHRYYGIGLLLCGLARDLASYEGREAAAVTVGKAFFEHWELYSQLSSGILGPDALSGTSASRTFAAAISKHAESMPPHVRMLSDVLSWHVVEREFAIRHGQPVSEQIHINKQERDGESHYVAGRSVNEVSRVTASASTRVLRAVLKLRGDYLTRHNPDFPREPTAQEIIDNTDMDDINLIPVAQRAAAMRLDEMSELEGRYLGLDEQGRAEFYSKKLPRSRDLSAANTHGLFIPIHTRRLRCPAIFVEDLIPTMMRCLIGGVKVADDLVNEELARRQAADAR